MNSTILNGSVNFPLCLAPMVGISHYPLRKVLRSYMPPETKTLWPTEMLNSRRIPDEKLGETSETLKDEGEDGLVPQILGNEESFIQKSTEALKNWGAEAIDINMGCPVQKALRHNYGVALMGDSAYASEVVRMTVRSTSLPVSVKLRAGHQNDFEFLKKFAKGLEEAGASWLCLHPRTPEQKRRGKADWNQVTQLKKELGIPLIGNGDIQTSQDVFDRWDESGCDMIMAGRALAARPWMMWQVGHRLGLKSPIEHADRVCPDSEEAEGFEYGKCLIKLAEECFRVYPQGLAHRKIIFYLRTTSVWLLFGHHLFSRVTKAKTQDEVLDAIKDFFQQPQPMTSRTDLRE